MIETVTLEPIPSGIVFFFDVVPIIARYLSSDIGSWFALQCAKNVPYERIPPSLLVIRN
jgi:hypothetical protein